MVARFTFKPPLDIFQGFSKQSSYHLCFVVPGFLILQAAVNVLYTHHAIPNFIAHLFLCNVVPFTPRDFSNPVSLTDAVLKFLGAPFAPPEPFLGSVVSRILQGVVLHFILRPSNSKASPFGSLVAVYLGWIPAGLMRSLISFVFTRALGWAYPSLFRHWAMYEKSEGFGAGLVVWFYLRMFFRAGDESEVTTVDTGSLKGAIYVLLHLHETSPFQDTLIPMGLSFIMIFMVFEGKPWTYACALLSAGLLWLLLVLIPSNSETQERLPSQVTRSGTTAAALVSRFFFRTFLPALRLAIITLFLICLFYFVQPFLSSLGTLTYLTPIPPPYFSGKNLLEIVILSHPRPGNLSVTEEIIMTTIDSFQPLLTPVNGPNYSLSELGSNPDYEESNIVLSLFTHAPDHLAFEYVKSKTTDKGVLFYVDEDTHSSDEYDTGQYLHLAEALRWVASDDPKSRRGRKRPEWIMLVEDDFPLCGKGAEILRRTLWLLEIDRRQSGGYETGTRTAFIGTGGSGLIFHHTLLKTLEHLLRTHALNIDSPTKTPFPPSPDRRPADVVMQDCLFGSDPLCARYTKPLRSLRLPSNTPVPVKEDFRNILSQSDDDMTMFVPSSMVMDHIGGMVSTTYGKKGNSDKWRCGWRHAFHGRREVGVLVV